MIFAIYFFGSQQICIVKLFCFMGMIPQPKFIFIFFILIIKTFIL